jgi:excisionase family DNA binding protein
MESREEFDWVSVTEASDILGVTRPSVYKLVREGILPAYKIEGLRGIKFDRADVLALIRKVDPEHIQDEDEELD